MGEIITQESAMKAMSWAYNKAVNGAIGLDSAYDLANDYKDGTGTMREKANKLIRYQNVKAGTSGFVTGLGGLATMPVTLPANLTSVLFVQIRMIAAIAIMGGYDPKNDRVQTLVYSCLVVNSVEEIGKSIGIKLGQKIATQAIKNLSKDFLIKINQKVGFRLVTKFGEKGIINLGKAIPIVGGVIGGSIDIYTTNKIGNIARDLFIPE